MSTGNGLSVGLDIGGTKTLGLVVDPAGGIRAEVRESTEPGTDGVLRTAERVVEALRTATGEPLTGPVGVGIPGIVDAAQGTVKHAVNLGVEGEWLPLAGLLGERLGVPVVVENDVNAAALGAVALTGEDDLAYLSIGTGLAAGLVLGGRLRRGDHGAAGEIGHLPVDPSGALCACGQRGCLETIASGSAIAAAWPTADGLHPAEALFGAAQAGDPKAVHARDRFADGVARAVSVLGLAVDPRAVVLGGGVAQLGEQLRVAVAAALGVQAAESPFIASLDLGGRLRVVPSDYPVAAVGAARLGGGEGR